jgi:hypothetical protein
MSFTFPLAISSGIILKTLGRVLGSQRESMSSNISATGRKLSQARPVIDLEDNSLTYQQFGKMFLDLS